MSRPLIILVGLIYAWIAADFFWRGQIGLGITYGAYALGNVGMWMVSGN